jgi:two-component sensor histidine kinase
VVVTVRDDGNGISEQISRFQPDGVGIGGMRIGCLQLAWTSNVG